MLCNITLTNQRSNRSWIDVQKLHEIKINHKKKYEEIYTVNVSMIDRD